MDGWRQVVFDGEKAVVSAIRDWSLTPTMNLYPVVPEGHVVLRVVPPLCLDSEAKLLASVQESLALLS